jgi:hypothetical protein
MSRVARASPALDRNHDGHRRDYRSDRRSNLELSLAVDRAHLLFGGARRERDVPLLDTVAQVGDVVDPSRTGMIVCPNVQHIMSYGDCYVAIRIKPRQISLDNQASVFHVFKRHVHLYRSGWPSSIAPHAEQFRWLSSS